MVFRIAVIGATYAGNKGAAGMLTAVVDNLQAIIPNIKFRVLSLYPKKDIALKQDGVEIIPLPVLEVVFLLPALSFLYMIFSWIPFIANSLRKYSPLSVLVQADVLLDLSGISFVDGRTGALVYNVCCLLPAFFVKTKTIKMSQALGPFRKFLNRTMATALLGRVKTVYARGKITSNCLSSIGLNNWKRSADLAFLLDSIPDSNLIDNIFCDQKKLLIGVSPSQVLTTYCAKKGIRYVEILAAALNSVSAANDASILIVAHSNLGAEVVSRNNDYQICSKLFALCRKGSAFLILEDRSSGELREIIGHCDVFLASRFHSMISALCMCTPTIVTSWSHKYREVMDDFECGDWILKMEEITETSLVEMLNTMINNRKIIAEKIKRNLPSARASALIQIEDVAAMLQDYQK